MMLLVGQIGPKLFLPICIILSKNDVIITDFSDPGAKPWRNFTPPLPRWGSLRKWWCSDVGDARDLLCCSGFISSDEQAMQGSAWSSLAKLWVRWLARIFTLPWLDRRQPGMTLWILFLCARVSAQRAGQSTSEDPALRQWPFPLHIDIGLCFYCSQWSQLRRNESATAGEVAALGLSFFAIQLAGQLAPAPSLYASQHFSSLEAHTSNRFPFLCPTFSTVWQIFQKSSPLAHGELRPPLFRVSVSVTRWSLQLTCNAWSSTTKKDWQWIKEQHVSFLQMNKSKHFTPPTSVLTDWAKPGQGTVCLYMSFWWQWGRASLSVELPSSGVKNRNATLATRMVSKSVTKEEIRCHFGMNKILSSQSILEALQWSFSLSWLFAFGLFRLFNRKPPSKIISVRWNEDSTVDFSSVVDSINAAYAEIIHWKKNLFSVPFGRMGKTFVDELTRLFQALGECSA